MLLDILSDDDPCTLFSVVLLLLAVGSFVSNDAQRHRAYGVAILAFLAYGCHAWDVLNPTTAEELFDLCVRAVAAGGIALGLAWIALPILDVVYRHLVATPRERCRSWAEAVARRTQERRHRRELDLRKRRDEADARELAERDRHRREEESKLRASREREAATRAETERRRIEVEKARPRQHLTAYYEGNASAFTLSFPRHLLEAFLLAEMHDGLEAAQLWAVCQRKIAELQVLVVQERERARFEAQEQLRKRLQLRKLESDLEDCRQQIAALEKARLEPDLIEDERQALLLQLRRLEDERELLLTLGE